MATKKRTSKIGLQAQKKQIDPEKVEAFANLEESTDKSVKKEKKEVKSSGAPKKRLKLGLKSTSFRLSDEDKVRLKTIQKDLEDHASVLRHGINPSLIIQALIFIGHKMSKKRLMKYVKEVLIEE